MPCSLPAVNRERVNSASVSSLISLLSFQMGTNTILDNIPTHSVIGFHKKKPALAIKGEESRKSATPSAILEISGELNLLLNLKRSH